MTKLMTRIAAACHRRKSGADAVPFDRSAGGRSPSATGYLSGVGIAALLAVGTGLGLSGGGGVETLRYSILAAMLAVATASDLEWRRVPNALVIGGSVVALLLLFVGAFPSAGEAVGAAVSAAGLLLSARVGGALVFGRPGMGMGDVKLAFAVWLFMGWQVLWALYLAVLVGGLVAGAGLLLQGWSRRARLPFAPFIAAGTGLSFAVACPLSI